MRARYAHKHRPECAQTPIHIFSFPLSSRLSALTMRQSNHSSWALAARIGPPVTAPLLDDARYPHAVAPTCTVRTCKEVSRVHEGLGCRGWPQRAGRWVGDQLSISHLKCMGGRRRDRARSNGRWPYLSECRVYRRARLAATHVHGVIAHSAQPQRLWVGRPRWGVVAALGCAPPRPAAVGA